MATPQLAAGQVWWIKGTKAQFPNGYGPPDSDKPRPPVILTGDNTLTDPNFPTVLVAFCSTQTQHATSQDLILRASQTPVGNDSPVMLSMVQATRKTDLVQYIGTLQPLALQMIQRKILHILGLERRR